MAATHLSSAASRGLSTPHKLGLLAGLYLAQGLPFGFFMQALPVLMRQRDYSLELVGLSSLLAIPWACKWLWAPWVDRHYWPRFGRRRSWLLPLQLASGVTLLGLAWLGDRETFVWVLVGCFVTNVLAATQDIASDGLAVELLSPTERGLGNGVQVAGYRLGMIVGGGAILVVFEHWGWWWAMLCLAGGVLLTSVPVLSYAEAETGPAPEPGNASRLWRNAGARVWLLIVVVYKAGDALATGMLRPFLVDRGFGMADIGWLVGGWGSVAGLLGALLGGALTSRWGVRRALLWFGLASAASVLGYALVAQTSPGRDSWIWLGVIGFEHFAGGLATVALFTAMMGFCRPGSEGSDYTVQASLVVVCTGAAHALSGFSAASLGYPIHFALAGAIAALVSLVAYQLFVRVDRPHDPESSARR